MEARVIRSDGGLWLGGLRWEEKGETERLLEQFSRWRISCSGNRDVFSYFDLLGSALDFNEQRDYEECARISGAVAGGVIGVSEGWTPGQQIEVEGHGLRYGLGVEYEYIAESPQLTTMRPVSWELSPVTNMFFTGPPFNVTNIEAPGVLSDPLGWGSLTVSGPFFPPQPEQPKEEPTSKPPAEQKFKPTRGGPISRARFLLMKRRGSW